MPDERYFQLPFGFRIQREADWVAVLALLITLVLVSFEVRRAFVGADVKLLYPGALAVFEHQCGHVPPNVEVAIPIGLANVAPQNYDAIVSNMSVILSIGSRMLEFEPSIVAVIQSPDVEASPNVVHDCSSDRRTLAGFEIVKVPHGKTEAVPINVKAGSAESRSVWFIPKLIRESNGALSNMQPNLVSVIDLLDIETETSRIFMDISIEIYQHGRISEMCSFAFTKRERDLLREQKWISPGIQC